MTTLTRPRWAEAIAKRRLIDLRASQGSVATLAGGHLTQSDLSRIERGLLHPHDLTVLKFLGLLKALGWTIDEFSQATGLAPGLEPDEAARLEALEATAHLQVRPEYVRFPVYASAAAGAGYTASYEVDAAFVSRPKFTEKEIDPSHFVVLQADVDCLISAEARGMEKSIALGDHLGIDTRRPRAGAMVAAWWEEEKKLVLKRHRWERENVVLYPLAPGQSSTALPTDEDLKVVGSIVWRQG